MERENSSDDAGRGADKRSEETSTAGSQHELLVDDVIRGAGWPALHGLPWPGRPSATLDSLALSKPLIWVVDAEHWTGEVLVHHGVLQQDGHRRDETLDSARRAARDLRLALGHGAPQVHPLVCLTQAGASLSPQVVGGVKVVGVEHLLDALGPPPQGFEGMPELVERVRRATGQTPPGEAPAPEGRATQTTGPTSVPRRQVGLAVVALLVLLVLVLAWANWEAISTLAE